MSREQAIEQALIDVRDDLNRRAEDGCVAVGHSVWLKVNNALAMPKADSERVALLERLDYAIANLAPNSEFLSDIRAYLKGGE
jgi:hypothetical protein